MPVLLAFALVLAAVLLAIAIMPLALVQRYRHGTARRAARGWVIGLNMWGMLISCGLFLISAGVTSIWVPGALTYSAAGMAAGCLVGLVGLALTKWEPTTAALFYKPNRWLVLTLTLVVTARLLYGVWRTWETWRVAAEGSAWLVTSGVAGSLAAGAVVLGYYATYWTGVRSRLKRYHRRATFMN